MTLSVPAPNPCQSCPYRRDVPSGVWSQEEYEKLVRYDEPTYAQPQGMFQCHQNGREDDRARLCAGWVATHGDQSLALRLAVVRGQVDPAVMDYTTDVPLFGSGVEAAEHGMAEIDCPGPQARVLIDKITQVRPDVCVD